MKNQLLFAVKLFALAGGYFFTRSRSQIIKYREREKSIPDVAVFFLLANLKRFLLYHANLIRDARNQIERLENDVCMFKAFLIDVTKRRYKNDALKELERQIRDLVYDGEDIIDAFQIQTAKDRPRNFFEKCIGGPMKLVSLAKEVNSIRTRVKSAYEKSRIVFATLKAGGVPEDLKTKDKKMSFIGLERKHDILIRNVTEASIESSVIDTLGFGKTRRKEYYSAAIQESDVHPPLAIGYVFYKSPIHVRVSSHPDPMAY